MIRINQKVYRIIDIMVDIMVVSWFWRWVKSSNEVTQKTVSNTTPQHKKEPKKVWLIPQHQETPGINFAETRESAFEVYCAKYDSDNNGVVVLWCYS